MKRGIWLALSLWIAFAAIARGEIETYQFTGTVFNTHGSTFFGGLPVPPVGTSISGQFQYNTNTTAYRTAPVSPSGTISVYPQNISGGFSANFGSISVVASSYNVNVYNDQQQYDGSLRDSFYVQWYSSDTPQPNSPLKVNGTNQSQYIFSMSLKYPSTTWNDTSLPSSLSTSGFDTYNPDAVAFPVLSSSPIVNVVYYISSLTPVPLLRGDWNRDGSLTSADLNTMLGAITNIDTYTQNLQSSGYSQSQCMTICDVNGDGKITNADIQAEINLLRNAGAGGAAIVPEPTSFVLLGIGTAALTVWGRKRVGIRADSFFQVGWGEFASPTVTGDGLRWVSSRRAGIRPSLQLAQVQKGIRPGPRTRYGFTLIELMVVVTILGLLTGLLLPALQGSRESSRRAACANHLKQTGLALASHESARHALPMGVHGNPSFGLSFWPFIMPYMEYSSAVEKFNIYNPAAGAMGANMLVDGIVIEPLICPSSPFAPLYPYLGVQVTMPHYTGIAGATALDDGFPETRVTACCVPDHFVGQISGGGVLVPNQYIRFKQITDGLSKTLAVGECSDYANDTFTGGKIRVDAGVTIGWLAGTYEQGTPPNYGVKNTPSSPKQAWNIVTIRYAPNMRDYSKPGVHRDGGANNPLLSAHPGGANGVMADGSVHMLSDGMDVWLLKQLATRDDGQIGSLVP